ncbi:MAG: DUF2911 domain-containing protein [Cyclobacteriaceae bacterium]
MGKSKNLLMLAMCLITSISMAQISTPPGGGNQQTITKQFIGKVPYVEIVYNSPDVTGPNGQSRKGQIWGGLVPYGFNALGFGLSTAENPSPWRAGANENTTIEFSHDVLIEGKELKAGKYGFFIAPAESGSWTLIFSTDNNHWGSFFYKPENDALRVDVTTEDVGFHEDLTFEFFNRKATSATVALIWENKKVPFNVEVKDSDKVHLATIEAELNNSAGFTFANYQAAANYASGVGAHDKAIAWADAAISAPFFGQKNFGTMQTKAGVLRAAGKNDEAFAVMDEAIKLPGANALAIHGYGRQLIAAGEKEKALEVFKYNQKTNKGAWPTNYGLARGYSAVGDYKQALKYLQLAKANVPANDAQNGPIIDQNIEKLKKGEDIN